MIEECPTLPDEKKRPQKELNNGNDATIENESTTKKPSKPTKNDTKTSKPKLRIIKRKLLRWKEPRKRP